MTDAFDDIERSIGAEKAYVAFPEFWAPAIQYATSITRVVSLVEYPGLASAPETLSAVMSRQRDAAEFSERDAVEQMSADGHEWGIIVLHIAGECRHLIEHGAGPAHSDVTALLSWCVTLLEELGVRHNFGDIVPHD